MRISEDRYARDLRRLNVAHRLIRHEVRTRWICAWTGLSGDRVRNLYRSYYRPTGSVKRWRGPSRMRLASYLHSGKLRTEASAIGGLACAFGVIPCKAIQRARTESSGLDTGERFLRVFELFQKFAPQSRFKMDELIGLASALGKGEDLQIGHCSNCHGTLLLDPFGTSRRICPTCRQDSFKKRRADGQIPPNDPKPGGSDVSPEEDHSQYQYPLF